jgi:hypothetical protein
MTILITVTYPVDQMSNAYNVVDRERKKNLGMLNTVAKSKTDAKRILAFADQSSVKLTL